MLPIQVVSRREVAENCGRHNRCTTSRKRIFEVRHAMCHEGAQERLYRPSRSRQTIPCQPQTGTKRRRKPCTYVVLSVGRNRYVNRDDKSFEPCSLYTINERVDSCLIARQVGLEPSAGALFGNHLHGDERRPAHHRDNAGFHRSGCQHHVTSVGRQSIDAHRGDSKRRLIRLTKELHSLASL